MAAPAYPDTELRALVQSADRAIAAGKREEAQRLIAQAEALSPEHPLVLNARGVFELRGGDAVAARALLERAIQLEGRNPAFWINLASTYRRLGQQEEESGALERALALDPRHLLGLLQKASLLELQGKTRAAAAAYGNALATLPRGARIPDALRVPIQRATEAVRQNAAALETFLAERLRDLRSRHARSDLARLEHCIDAVLGKRSIYTPRPTFLHFPKLPAWEFFPREHFAWLEGIESATTVIRAEFERVFLEATDRLEPYISYPQGVPLDQWAELNHSRR